MTRIRLIAWSARADGSYESTTQPRWEPGEERALDDADAAGLLRDYPGAFEVTEPPEDPEDVADPSTMTVARAIEALEGVDHDATLRKVLEAERAGKARKTLIAHLESLIEGDVEADNARYHAAEVALLVQQEPKGPPEDKGKAKGRN